MKKVLALLLTLAAAAFTNAQKQYALDRVYTANQVSNTVSVIDPSSNQCLGAITLGKPFPNALNALYRGQALVHGLRYLSEKKLLAVVSIGSNAVTLVSTETNEIVKTIYVGRSPHEPTFTPDGKQLWVVVRGEAYVSVIDMSTLREVRRVPVADGPGMVAFTPDGKFAYVCSSFTPELDIVNTITCKIVKRLPVTSPFSPNIFTSPNGKWIAFTHKDVGRVTIVSTATQSIEKVLETGPITNHVTFCIVNKKLLMLVTVGGENKVKVFDAENGFTPMATITVGALPHGIWASPDGQRVYVGLEYDDKVQAIDLQTMSVVATTQIGHSPQALVYAANAVTIANPSKNLTPLADTTQTQIINFSSPVDGGLSGGRLAVRALGLIDFIEQAFHSLQPNHAYTLAFSKAAAAPFSTDYVVNRFTTDSLGNYNGQSTGLIKTTAAEDNTPPYLLVVLTDSETGRLVLVNKEAKEQEEKK